MAIMLTEVQTMTKRKNPAAVAMAKLRVKKLGPERTKEIASHAANSRWAKMSEEDRKEAMAKVMAGRKNLKPKD